MRKKLIREGIKALREQFNAASIARGAAKFNKSPDAFFNKRMPKKPQVIPGNPMFSQKAIRNMEKYVKSIDPSASLYMSTPDNPREFRPDPEFGKVAKGELNLSNVNDNPNMFTRARDYRNDQARQAQNQLTRYRLNPVGSPIFSDDPTTPNPEEAAERMKSGNFYTGFGLGFPDAKHGSRMSDKAYRDAYSNATQNSQLPYQALDSLTSKVDNNPNTKPGTALNPLDMEKARGSVDYIRKQFQALNKMYF
jgi:hypothetical protein